MKEKTRQIALYVLMALIIVTMFTASLTLGRYSSEQSSDGGYGSDMEFILTTQVEVHSVDDFFLAIENGYTNLKIADDMDNPLIITSDTSNVKSDLIIDLNGHEIQRNNTTPLLQVQNGITLTIIDSKGGGSLYNPVGSVLQIGGSSTVEGSVTEGFLNVQAGIFESGPRNGRRNWTDKIVYDEYAEYAAGSDNSWSTPSGGSFEGTVSAEVYRKDSAPTTENDDGYTSLGEVQMPVIVPVTVENDTNYTVSGNMYFDKNSTVAYGNNVITEDTYIFFTVEDDPSVESNFSYSVGSADYYYSYTLYYSEENGVRRYSADPQDGTPATVKAYIYNNVKGNAESVTNGYAAIKMTAGEINVNGGDYHAYFGVNKSYCINVTGGMMEINSANSNFYAYENSVCVQCDYAENDPNKYLKISDGNFYSELGDTVVVSRGRTDIVSADFTKDASSNMFEVTGTSFTGEQLAAYYNANNSVIDITGGSLTISQSATFNITGSGVTGIRASGSGASVTTYNTTFNFYGGGSGSTLDSSFNRAVYTGGGSVTCVGATNILMARNKEGQTAGITSRYNVGVLAGGSSSVTFSGNAEIDINGNATPSGGNYGIYSTGGTITCGENANASTTITIAANSASTGNYGIYSTGGTITTRGTTKITLGNSAQAASLETLSRTNYGIFSEGGTVTCGEGGGTTNITINGTTQNVTVGTGENATVHTSQDNFGIYSGQLTTTEGSSTAGKISIAGMATIKINGAYSSGIDSDGGTINISGSSFKCYVTMSQNDTTLSSTAINTSGGNITVGAAHVDIQSNGLGVTVQGGNITFSDYSGTVPSDIVKGTAITANRGTALFVAGQNSYLHFESGVEVEIESTLTPGTTWASAEGSTETDNNVSLTNGVLIMGGSVYVNGSATVTSTVAGGDWATGINNTNKATLSNFNGVYVQSGSLYVGSRMGENNQIEVTNANALLDVTSSIESSGTTFPALTFNGGSYSGVYVQGGSLYSYGTLNVTHTGVQNDSVASGDTAFLNQTIKSYSVRVEGDNSTSVTITKGEITNSIGGGVYVSGGTTVLGESSANNLKVSTTGYGSYGAITLWSGSTWHYINSQTGGHAVQVNGGNLTINNGEFTAAQGNGIIVSNGTANVHSGTFKGNDRGKGNITQITGPGASAGLKVVGGTANIYGGTFGENSTTNNSGAFVMGTANARAKVNVVGGTFYAYGADAFTIFRYATVKFDPGNTNKIIEDAGQNVGGDINVTGNGASAISVTDDRIYAADENRGSEVRVYSGTYISNQRSDNDAIWSGCSADRTYIHGGTFTGGRYAINVTAGYVACDWSEVTLNGPSGQTRGTVNDL